MVPKRLASSFLYLTLLSGGRSGDEKEGRVREGKMMVFFRDFFSPFLSKTSTKAAVVLVFLGYLGVAGLGISRLQEGLDLQALVGAGGKWRGWLGRWWGRQGPRNDLISVLLYLYNQAPGHRGRR